MDNLRCFKTDLLGKKKPSSSGTKSSTSASYSRRSAGILAATSMQRPPPATRPHLRDHLAEGRPKGRFHRTPCSCTLVLMSRTSESDCSIDDQGDNREVRDEEDNMLSEASHTPQEEEEEPMGGSMWRFLTTAIRIDGHG